MTLRGYFGNMNSTLGSVVPLAMFDIVSNCPIQKLHARNFTMKNCKLKAEALLRQIVQHFLSLSLFIYTLVFRASGQGCYVRKAKLSIQLSWFLLIHINLHFSEYIKTIFLALRRPMTYDNHPSVDKNHL